LPAFRPAAEPRSPSVRSYRMPRFFFHLKDGVTLCDDEGMSFATVDEARREAVRTAREIMADDARRDSLNLVDRIEIADEGGNAVTVVTFADAARLYPRAAD
jgi:Domain of unknown function (DUF6894)